MKIFNKGFSLIEVMVVLTIVVMITIIASFSLREMNKGQILDKSTLTVLSVLNEARSMAMSSKDFSDYGVHLEQSSIISFKGAVFNGNDLSNKEYDINNIVKISEISLSQGGSDIVFKKVSGETNNFGYLKISSVSDPSDLKTINIFSTGATEQN